MELLQLRYFLRSAMTENFSVTASEYRVPASSVSASIKKLENELGVQLFIRSANKIKLSQTGREFAEAVSQALSLVDTQILKIQEEKQNISGDIFLLVRTERSLITDKMAEFRAKYPAVSFRMVHNYNDNDYSKYDIIIDEGSSRYGSFIQKPLITEKIKIAASANNPLSDKKVYLNELLPIRHRVAGKNAMYKSAPS